MAERVAAIGCGGEESSSAANGLLLSPAGSWKADEGVEVFERSRACRRDLAAERLTDGLLRFQLLFLA